MLSKIETLGPELLRKIAASCDKKTLDAFASTSSHIRLPLIDVIHKRVRFCDEPEALSQKLGDFLNVLKMPSRMIPYSTVRSAYFNILFSSVHEQEWETTFSDPLPVATCLPLQIFDSIRAMCNLRSLSLVIGEFTGRQESFFYGLLQNIEIQAEYIRIYASDRIIKRVLEKSPRLQALHLPASTAITKFQPVVGGLRRLCTSVGRVKHGGPIQFPTINEGTLRKIAERYQGLEELVLEQESWNTTDDNEAIVSAFEEDFTKAIKIFKRMRGLKRLAIYIDEETACFCHTEANVYGFYTARLLRLSTCLPRLVQIAITNDDARYWMVTKASSGELTINRGRSKYQDAEFPHSVNEGF